MASSNSVEIIGLLSENNLKKGSYTKDGISREYIGGSITVRVEQKIDSIDKVLEIPIQVFANRQKKDGGDNPAWTSWNEVFDFTSIAAAGGEEKADAIRVVGSLGMNEFYGRDNRLNSYPQIRGGFARKVRRDDMKMGAIFEYDGMVRDKCYEINEQGDETGRLRVNICIPQWGGLVDTIPFYVSAPKAIDFIEDNWQPRDTVPFRGKLNFSTKTETKLIESAFGDATEKTYTTSIRELIITGGDFPLEAGYSFDEIERGIKLRDEKLAADKEKNQKPARVVKAPAADSASLGF